MRKRWSNRRIVLKILLVANRHTSVGEKLRGRPTEDYFEFRRKRSKKNDGQRHTRVLMMVYGWDRIACSLTPGSSWLPS